MILLGVFPAPVDVLVVSIQKNSKPQWSLTTFSIMILWMDTIKILNPIVALYVMKERKELQDVVLVF